MLLRSLLWAALALLLAPEFSLAQDSVPAARWSPRFEEFVERLGVRARVEGQRLGARESFHTQIDALASQVRGQHGSFPEQELGEYVREAKAAVDETLERWSVDDAIAEFAEAFERAYPGDELDAALDQLETPDGRKLASAMLNATSELSHYSFERVGMQMGRQFDRVSRQLLRRVEEFARTGK